MISVDILNSLSAHILVVNDRGHVIFVNTAWQQFVAQYGQTAEKDGKKLHYLQTCSRIPGFVTPVEGHEAMAGIEHVLQGRREDFALEYTSLFPGGHRRFLMNCRPLQPGRTNAVISHTEITDTKQQERQQLEESRQQLMKQDTISKLAGGIAHDFNNILAAIIGYSELAILHLPPSSPSQNHINGVLLAGKRARDLIKGFLSFSREDRHEIRPFALLSLITETLGLLRSILPKNLLIQEDLGQFPGIIVGNTGRIQQMIMYLCSTAAELPSGREGRLVISLGQTEASPELQFSCPGLRLDTSYVRLRISSNGHLDEDGQASSGNRSTVPGADERMAPIQGILREHKGEVMVTSTKEQGTTFTVYLPGLVEKASEQAIPVQESRLHGRGHILIVDDEASLVDITTQNLESLGYSVTSKLHSHEALEAFSAAPGRFDLVISDLTMPGITGDKLAASLLEVRPDIPIIIYTGYSSPEMEQKASQLGIKAVLPKPTSRNELALLIRNILADRNLISEQPPDQTPH